ncbi:MAG: hypothetical protein J6R47_05110 [Acholeplasmatales bacterium]|nr:hypothetical protein [Acholeplasmatales bacterium]
MIKTILTIILVVIILPVLFMIIGGALIDHLRFRGDEAEAPDMEEAQDAGSDEMV